MTPEDAERLGKVQLRLARHSFNPVDPAEWEHVNDVRADLWWAADLLRRQDATITRLQGAIDRVRAACYEKMTIDTIDTDDGPDLGLVDVDTVRPSAIIDAIDTDRDQGSG